MKIFIQRLTAIHKQIDEIYPKIADFSEWKIWSPWLIADPKTRINISENGKFYQWESPITGTGNMKIMEENKPSQIDMNLQFLKPMKSRSKVSFFLEPQGPNTKVTWTMEFNAPIFFIFWKKSMENFIGIWWSGSENDVLPAGTGAHGYKSLAFTAPGTNFQVHKDIKKYVHDKGEASGDGSHFGTVLYNRGLFQAMVQVEAAVVAQKIHGTSKITPAMYRDGMEAVNLSAKRMEELGFKDFAPPFKNTCENHGGSGLAAVQQWDAKAKKWNMITEYMYGDSAVVQKLIAEDSSKYAAEQKIAERCN